MASLKKRMESSFSSFLIDKDISLLTVQCLEREDILSKRDFCNLDVVELMLFSNRGVPIGQISKLRIIYAELKGLPKSTADAPTVAAISSQVVQKYRGSEGKPQRFTHNQSRVSGAG